MTEYDRKKIYLQKFSKIEKNLAGSKSSWIKKIRSLALSSFAELGFPTQQEEEWRFTPVEAIVETNFEPVIGTKRMVELRNPHLQAIISGQTASHLSTGTSPLNYCQMVFINGHYSPDLSSLQHPLYGVQMGSLAHFLETDSSCLEPYLARLTDKHLHGFTALNTAFFNDGAFIYLPKGTELEFPIHLLFVSVPSGDSPFLKKKKIRKGTTLNGAAPVSYPRVLIVAEKESKATIVESYMGFKNELYFTNALSEIVVKENALIEHCKVQQESKESFHIATLQVRQERNSNFTSHSISFGGALVRNEIHTALEGEGADCALNGLYMVSGRQHVDNHTTIDHLKAHGSSRELYKGVLDGKSRAVFNGKIVVRQDAQKTDAMQTNKNLLLSDEGLIDTKPELKILADDVKCKHGATIGQIAPDVLFYLRSRGIEKEEARRLLIHAFAREMIDRINTETIRSWLLSNLPVPFSDSFQIKEGHCA